MDETWNIPSPFYNQMDLYNTKYCQLLHYYNELKAVAIGLLRFFTTYFQYILGQRYWKACLGRYWTI